MKNYTNELEGQKEFYERFGLLPDFIANSDGVYKGILFENKLTINNLGAVLSQLIRYASKLRMLGQALPYYLIANDLNREQAYIFKSQDFLDKIEHSYYGGASYNTENIVVSDTQSIDYSGVEGIAKLSEIINKNKYTKYHVDFTNILGVAREFYKVKPSKDLLLDLEQGELRQPVILKDRIIPYTKKTNKEFESIMDCLNTKALQKDLGAFYTPDVYVKYSQEILLKYIKNVIEPTGLDYVVVDTCAGVGNLVSGLPDEILAHCILSTLEPNEYLVLQENFGDKCLVVVPPVDALKYDIIPAEIDNEGNVINDIVREKIKDPNTVVIMYENPPYSAVGGGAERGEKRDTSWKQSFICNEMKKEIKGVASNDLCNLFIWKAFKYYLTKPLDSYILYAPIKYFKSQNLVNKNIIDGFLCNKVGFHASEGVISCIQWSMKDEEFLERKFKAINTDESVSEVTIQKIYHPTSEAYDKRKFADDVPCNVICESNGKEAHRKSSVVSIYNPNIIGYLVANRFDIDPKNYKLTRGFYYDGGGFPLRKDNYLEKLPLFVASVFPKNHWLDFIYNKTFDSLGSYEKDKNFLDKCFIYTVLSFQNKCRSFRGSDGRLYLNELCFTKAGLSVADKYIATLELDVAEEKMIHLFFKILDEVINKEEYRKEFTYGTYQIQDEINIRVEVGVDKKGKPIKSIKYPMLNTMILELKSELRDYYTRFLKQDLFKYQLVK